MIERLPTTASKSGRCKNPLNKEQVLAHAASQGKQHSKRGSAGRFLAEARQPCGRRGDQVRRHDEQKKKGSGSGAARRRAERERKRPTAGAQGSALPRGVDCNCTNSKITSTSHPTLGDRRLCSAEQVSRSPSASSPRTEKGATKNSTET